MVIQPSAHARERWTTRADTTNTDLDPEDAWPDAERVRDTSLTGDEIRYHDDTGTLLVRKGIALVTVIDAYTAEIPTQRAVAKLTDYECPRCNGSTTGEDVRCPDCQRVQDIVGGMTDDELRTDGGSDELSVTTAQEFVEQMKDDPETYLAAESDEDHDAGQHDQYVRYAGTDEYGDDIFEVSILSASFPHEGERITDEYPGSTIVHWINSNDVRTVDADDTDAFTEAVA